MEASIHAGAAAVETPASSRRGASAPQGGDDRAILEAVRGGDIDAYGALYSRHVSAVRRLARRLAHDRHEADDIVSDVFANTLRAIRRGRGPHDDARAYLLRSVRHTAANLRSRKDTGRSQPVPIDRLDRAIDADVHLRSDVEIALTHLPSRHRDVLWATCVEGRAASELAAEGGLDASCVTSLALRARRALGRSYLLQRTTRPEPTDQCHRVRASIPSCLRDDVSTTTAAAVEAHVDECEECRTVYDEMGRLDQRLCSVTLVGLVIAVVRGWLRLGEPVAAALSKPLASALVAGAVMTGAIATEPPVRDRDSIETAPPSSMRSTRPGSARNRHASAATDTEREIAESRPAPTDGSTPGSVVDDEPTAADILDQDDPPSRTPEAADARATSSDALAPEAPAADQLPTEPLPTIGDVLDDTVEPTVFDAVATVTAALDEIDDLTKLLVAETTTAVGQELHEVVDGAGHLATAVDDAVAPAADTFVAATEPVTESVDETVVGTGVLDPLPVSTPTTAAVIDTVDDGVDATFGAVLGGLGDLGH